MELLFRHFWIAFVIVTTVNGRAWWDRVQNRIRSNRELEPGYRRLYRGYLLSMNLPWLVMGLGILSGQVPSIFDFLRPSAGNSFVLAWWGLMAALLCVGTYWIFAGGGAETLERHPGVYMVPQWSAAKLRLFWLGVVAWNVAIGTLLLLGFPGGPAERSTSPAVGPWLWALFPVFFVGMWLLVTFLLSAMGGWRALAQHYVASSPFSGQRFRFRSAQLGGYVNYGGCLTLGAGPSGLYLAVLPLFRMAHPPLIVPWTDITAREVRSWFLSAIELEFAKVPGVSVRLSRRLAQSLFDASGMHVVVAPAA
jgi:hypothetical protein